MRRLRDIGRLFRSRLFCLMWLASGTALAAQPATKADILWDTWGVPHIFASDERNLFHAFGWAQAHSHGDLLLRLYGQARGRAAEYWGEEHLASDRWMLTNGVPERAQEWLERQPPEFRRNLEAFAAGINAYARAHPARIGKELHAVLPVGAVDVLAHLQRVIYFTFVTSPERALDEAETDESAAEKNGSNAWAIGPARAAGGRAMLLANPHLPWSGLYLFYEAQLHAPGIDVYGVTLVGLPVIVIGFNGKLGWTHTVNPIDVADVYRLSTSESGYRWDGAVKTFDEVTRAVKIKQRDGGMVEQALRVRRSVHGPVIKEEAGRAYALRVAGLDRAGMAEQWWAMAKAASLGEFEAALRRMQIPMFNVLYADRAGNILYLYNGLIPMRGEGSWDQWQQAVDGETSATLWQRVHAYDDLPRVLNPPGHWLHNANDPPWFATLPQACKPESYPSYFVPPSMGLRAQRSARLVAEDARISFDEMIRYKHATRVELADRVLDPLLAAAEKGGPAVREAAKVLRAWDRKTDADSRGAVLFSEWAREMGFLNGDDDPYAVRWHAARPLTTPSGLADLKRALDALETAAAKVRAAYGALSVEWGSVARLRYGDRDLPANGGPGGLGIYRVLGFKPGADGRHVAMHGDTFVAAIEFGARPRASVLLAYGNASQSHSPHRGDQLRLFAEKKMRPAWRTRAEIAKHLARREKLAYSDGLP
ncbi:MAG TPA: acylase [Paucimonas sp.]|nr:acylase [Paucimonas sp.]